MSVSGITSPADLAQDEEDLLRHDPDTWKELVSGDPLSDDSLAKLKTLGKSASRVKDTGYARSKGDMAAGSSASLSEVFLQLVERLDAMEASASEFRAGVTVRLDRIEECQRKQLISANTLATRVERIYSLLTEEERANQAGQVAEEVRLPPAIPLPPVPVAKVESRDEALARRFAQF